MPRRKDYPPLRNDYWPFATRPVPCQCDACAPTRKSEGSVRSVTKNGRQQSRSTLPVR